MKKWLTYSLLGLIAIITVVLIRIAHGAEQKGFQTQEYAVIRWAGRENTHLIRPSGQVEMLSPLFQQTKRPDRVDERIFLMNIALNAVAKEGFELAAMTSDEMVVRRQVTR